jgi:hypothetical protein
MKVRTAAIAVCLALGGPLIAVSPSSAAPKLVPMTFKLTDQDGKPMAHVRFQDISGSGSSQVSGWFSTNAHGVGHYRAIADSTVYLALAGSAHHPSSHREVSGQIYSIDNSEPEEELGGYVIPEPDSGDAGATSTFTLPDLVTHRIRVVTQDGKPVAATSIAVQNTSVAETDSNDISYLVVTGAGNYTNLNGWARFTTFQDDPTVTATESLSPPNVPSLQYNPTAGSVAWQTVSEGRYGSKDTLRIVVPYVPHFAHLTSRPGRKPGVAVVSATLRQVTGVLPHRKVGLYWKTTPNRALNLRGRTNAHGRITFRLKLRHDQRVTFTFAQKTYSPGAVIAKPQVQGDLAQCFRQRRPGGTGNPSDQIRSTDAQAAGPCRAARSRADRARRTS